MKQSSKFLCQTDPCKQHGENDTLLATGTASFSYGALHAGKQHLMWIFIAGVGKIQGYTQITKSPAKLALTGRMLGTRGPLVGIKIDCYKKKKGGDLE